MVLRLRFIFSGSGEEIDITNTGSFSDFRAVGAQDQDFRAVGIQQDATNLLPAKSPRSVSFRCCMTRLNACDACSRRNVLIAKSAALSTYAQIFLYSTTRFLLTVVAGCK